MRFVNFALCAVLLALLAMPVFAQIGPGPISSMNTWRVEESYSLGQVVIRNGVLYQSLVSGNAAHDPAGSPDQWSMTISGAGTALPSASTAGQAPVSTGAGTNYTAQSVAQVPTGQNAQPILNASSCGTSAAPSWCSGTDIGAWVMAAFGQLNGHPGKVLVDATQVSWPQSTAIVMPMSAQLDCQSSPIVWQGTSGAALAVASVFTSSSSPYLTAVSNCYFQGPGSVSTSTNIGVYVGADPAGIITPTNTQGSGIIFDNVKIYGFNTGWTNGSNAFLISLHHVDIEDNYNNIVSVSPGTGGVTNSGENMVLDSASVIANAANYGMYFNGFNNRWHITDTSFDYSTVANIFGAVNADFKSVHIEGATQCGLSVPAATTVNMHFYGGDWYINNAVSNTAFICIPSRSSLDVMTFDGGVFAAAAGGATVSNFIATGAATALQLCPGFTPVLYNNAIAPASFLVDSGSSTCSGFGSSASSNFVLNALSAVLGISNILVQGSMLQSGGTGTTTVPFVLIQPGGPTLVTTWTNTGTVFGINAPNGFSGLLFDYRVGGGGLSVFRGDWSGKIQALDYGTFSSCTASTGACGNNATGFFAVPAGGTTQVISTTYIGTAASANTEIHLTFDSSLSTKLGVTCDTVIAQPTVSARNFIGVGGGFTITMSAAPTSGKAACGSWNLIN